MRLVDLHPVWWAPAGRKGVAIIFDCPHCVATGKVHEGHQDCPSGPHRLCCSLNPPLDGGAPIICDHNGVFAMGLKESLMPWCIGCSVAWTRNGDTFENLSLSPSVDASAAGHWHGFVQNGNITP